MVNIMIAITGISDRDQLEWAIAINGIRSPRLLVNSSAYRPGSTGGPEHAQINVHFFSPPARQPPFRLRPDFAKNGRVFPVGLVSFW
jgi:hypothetical protein